MTSGLTDVEIPHERFTLSNGLQVLVHEDHSVPLVAVNLWYHVGSKNERTGLTGLAHLFEHLMFEGSAHVPRGEFDRHLESAGGVNNGSTTSDRTNYWITVPTGAEELALWLESDRMGFFLDALTQEKLDLQRDVVKNERRQTYENRPYGLAFEKILETVYPPGHPYHHPVIGSMEDLSRATLADATDFFRTFYAPGNASLAIAGDVSTREIEQLVQRYFGEIPGGPRVPKMSAPSLGVRPPRRIVLEDKVHLPRIYLVWHTPRQYTPADAALETISGVLSGGKTSRLHRRLVYEDQIAQDVSAFHNGCELDGTFFVIATAKPGVSLAELEAVLLQEIEKLAREGVTEEERLRTLHSIESEMVRSLERVGGFGGKADRLNEYLVFAGDAGFVGRDLERYRSVTANEIQETAGQWLGVPPCATLSIVPHDWPGLAAEESAA
jgi:zinc protease